MSDEINTTGETPVPQDNGSLVTVRKARGGEGLNQSMGCFVKKGETYEVDVELAAQCLIGGEFELVNEADAERVNAAVAAIKARDFPATEAVEQN